MTLHQGLGLTQSLLAEDGLAGLAGLTVSGHIDGPHPEGVLLLLHQALEEELQGRDVLSHADPVGGAALQHLDDVAVDLGAAVVLGFGPGEEAGGFGDVLH